MAGTSIQALKCLILVIKQHLFYSAKSVPIINALKYLKSE